MGLLSQATQQVIGTGSTLGGCACALCGTWIPYGTTHLCNWKPQTYTWPTTWSVPSMPAITSFHGSVKALKDLPDECPTGVAYYVTSENVLVVRQSGGWFHFDRQ